MGVHHSLRIAGRSAGRDHESVVIAHHQSATQVERRIRRHHAVRSEFPSQIEAGTLAQTLVEG